MLSYAEKLVLVKSVFLSLPIFYMSTLSLPVGNVSHLNIFLKHCFWRKYGMVVRGYIDRLGNNMLIWTIRGLRVLELATRNKCLLMKRLHKVFNFEDLAWVKLTSYSYFVNKPLFQCKGGSIWWRDYQTYAYFQRDCQMLCWKRKWCHDLEW